MPLEQISSNLVRRADLRLDLASRLHLALDGFVGLGLARGEQPDHDTLPPRQRGLRLLDGEAALQ